MSALTRLFFRSDVLAPPSTSETIAWWEARRPAYNLAVGATGLVTLGVVNLLMALPPIPTPLPWQASVFGPLIYAGLANICYTFGWCAELGIRKWLGDEVAAVGPAIFRYGFAFSIGLTLLPCGLAVLQYLARMTSAVFF